MMTTTNNTETITLPLEGTKDNSTAHPSIVLIDDTISNIVKYFQQTEAQEKQLREEYTKVENNLRNNQVQKIVLSENKKMLEELKTKILSVS